MAKGNSKRGAAARERGKNWERHCRKDLKTCVFPPDRVQPRTVQEAAGEGGADIACPVWSIECKIGKSIQIHAAMQQALEASRKNDRLPIVLASFTNQPSVRRRLAVMPYEIWLAVAGFLADNGISEYDIEARITENKLKRGGKAPKPKETW